MTESSNDYQQINKTALTKEETIMRKSSNHYLKSTNE
jgi:hypothetical protein